MRLNLTLSYQNKEHTAGIAYLEKIPWRRGCVDVQYGMTYDLGNWCVGYWGLVDTTTETLGRCVATGRELIQATLRHKLNGLSKAVERTSKQVAADGAGGLAFALMCISSQLEELADNPPQEVPEPLPHATVAEQRAALTTADQIEGLRQTYSAAAKEYLDAERKQQG